VLFVHLSITISRALCLYLQYLHLYLYLYLYLEPELVHVLVPISVTSAGKERRDVREAGSLGGTTSRGSRVCR
jgi:hypothetical protein